MAEKQSKMCQITAYLKKDNNYMLNQMLDDKLKRVDVAREFGVSSTLVGKALERVDPDFTERHTERRDLYYKNLKYLLENGVTVRVLSNAGFFDQRFNFKKDWSDTRLRSMILNLLERRGDITGSERHLMASDSSYPSILGNLQILEQLEASDMNSRAVMDYYGLRRIRVDQVKRMYLFQGDANPLYPKQLVDMVTRNKKIYDVYKSEGLDAAHQAFPEFSPDVLMLIIRSVEKYVLKPVK